MPKNISTNWGVKLEKTAIGVNASISKATLDLTEVGDNVMIGDYAHIGHNSKINEIQ